MEKKMEDEMETGIILGLHRGDRLIPSVAGGRWPVSGGRWPVAGVRWPVAGVRWPVSGVRCPMCGGRWPVAGVRCPMSGVWFQWPVAGVPMAGGWWPVANGYYKYEYCGLVTCSLVIEPEHYLQFGHGCSVGCSGHVMQSNMNVIVVWAWILWSSDAV